MLEGDCEEVLQKYRCIIWVNNEPVRRFVLCEPDAYSAWETVRTKFGDFPFTIVCEDHRHTRSDQLLDPCGDVINDLEYPLIRDLRETAEGAEGITWLPKFNCEVNLLVKGVVDRAYVERCCEVAGNPSGLLLMTLKEMVVGYYDRCLHSPSGGWSPGLWKPSNLDGFVPRMASVKPLCLLVYEPESDELAWTIDFSCDWFNWDKEFGMEWVVRGQKVLWVGPIMGINPWEECDF